MKEAAARPYRQKARARAAAQTRQRILEATVVLWRQMPWEEVTLGAIAEEAGVTIQTVLRKFGSKEGLVDACLQEQASGVEAMRNLAPVGDVDGAVEVLLTHYERDGDAVIRMLDLEHKNETARRITEHGREHHRRWCMRVFAPYLPPEGDEEREGRLDAFVAATDLYLWKLLRRDLGRTPDRARRTLTELLRALSARATEGHE